MFKTKPNWSVISVAVILSISIGIPMISNPEIYSMEPFMLAAIAAMLAGIWSELSTMNKQRSENEKQDTSGLN